MVSITDKPDHPDVIMAPVFTKIIDFAQTAGPLRLTKIVALIEVARIACGMRAEELKTGTGKPAESE